MRGVIAFLVGLTAWALPALADDWPDCNQLNGANVIEACTRILERWEESASDLAVAFNNRGLAYDNNGEQNRALADYDRALQLNPGNAVTYYNRGSVYNALGNYDRAISDYSKAIRLAPNQDLYYNHRGIAFDNNGELDRALADYDQTIRLNQNFDAAYNNRGLIYYKKGEHDRAIADFDRAIRLNPNVADYYNSRGNAFYAKQDYDDALTDYDQAIRLNPDFAVAYINRGTIFSDKGESDRAIAQYDKGIRLDPNSAGFYNSRGNAFLNKGEYDKALADFDQAIRVNPTAYTYDNRALAYINKGEYEHAIADCNQALKLNPKDDAALNNRAFAYIRTGNYDQALVDLDQAIKLNPTSSRAHKNRGEFYRAKGDLERALADLDQAIKLETDLVPAFTIRGLVYQAKGDDDRARADFTKALSLRARSIDSDAQQKAREQLVQLDKPDQEVASNAVSGSPASVKTGAGHLPIAAAASPLSAPSQFAIDQGRRIALVIGNSSYRAVTPLKNPKNDAHAIAEQFRKLGFVEVIEKQDLTLSQLSSELKIFGDKAFNADWAVVYYAGHGIEVGGVNYVIPVDAALVASAHVEEEAIPLERLLSKVEGARKLRLVILDACRDNPFTERFASAAGTRSVGRGLGRIEPNGGIMVAYSARDGHVALDGQGANSPFAQALVDNLEQPGVEISLLFRKVRDAVWNATHGRQEPFTYGSLPAEALYFKTAAN